MLWSGSHPLTAMRDGLWGVLMLAGVGWLAVSWSILRLEPSDMVAVAGAVIFFGALCEAVRALVGMRTWWVNAGMSVLFAATGAALVTDRSDLYTTPLSLVAWYLMVRGALDIAVSIMNRGTDRTWGLVMTLGVTQAGLGFYAASPASRTTDPVIVTLGALALLRGVADLATSLRLREVTHARHDVLQLPPERAAGVAGYSAGLADYPSPAEIAAPSAAHRATPPAPVISSTASPTAPFAAPSGTARPGTATSGTAPPGTTPSGTTTSGTTTSGTTTSGTTTSGTTTSAPERPARHRAAESVTATGSVAPVPGTPAVPAGTPGPVASLGSVESAGSVESRGTVSAPGSVAASGTVSAPGPVAAPGSLPAAGTVMAGSRAEGAGHSFHDEVVLTTADLDSRIADAGVRAPEGLQHRVPEGLPQVPHTPDDVMEKASASGRTGDHTASGDPGR